MKPIIEVNRKVPQIGMDYQMYLERAKRDTNNKGFLSYYGTNNDKILKHKDFVGFGVIRKKHIKKKRLPFSFGAKSSYLGFQ